MNSSPKFHHFDGVDWDYDDIFPGDQIVAPGTMAFTLVDDEERSSRFKLARSPFLVISVSAEGLNDGRKVYTYTVLTRHGLLAIVKTREVNANMV